MHVDGLSRRIIEKLPSATVTYIESMFSLKVEYKGVALLGHLALSTRSINSPTTAVVYFHDLGQSHTEQLDPASVREEMYLALSPFIGQIFGRKTTLQKRARRKHRAKHSFEQEGIGVGIISTRGLANLSLAKETTASDEHS